MPKLSPLEWFLYYLVKLCQTFSLKTIKRDICTLVKTIAAHIQARVIGVPISLNKRLEDCPWYIFNWKLNSQSLPKQGGDDFVVKIMLPICSIVLYLVTYSAKVVL